VEKDMELVERKRKILNRVVVKFIEKAEPVSSQEVSKNLDLELSSATIRKEMADLEELGYLAHPHTSAGKVPTDKGYRYYVDNLAHRKLNLSIKAKKDIPSIKLVVNESMEIEAIFQKASELLSRVTNYLSMVVAPTIYQSKLRHIELLKFQEDNLLLILITDTGRVCKKKFAAGSNYNNLDLQRVANILNLQLREKNIKDIDAGNVKIPENDAYLVLLINKVIRLIKNWEEDSFAYNRFFIYGAYEVLQQPEFIDLKKIHGVLSVIRNEYLLMRLFMNLSREKEVTVKIGSEISEEGTDGLSLVASRYKVCSDSTGIIGILGPKRMDYNKVINILSIFSRDLSGILSSRE
jgi:heat-inducible transcriptional repressor